MGKGIQICDRGLIPYPYLFLSCIFESGIVTLTFCTKRIAAFKVFTVSVDGKPYIVWNGDVFCAAAVLFAIIKVFVMAGTVCIRGCF